MPLSIVYLILCTALATAVPLPFIPNIILVPRSNSNSVTLTNRSCDQCLCESNSASILNCFPNNTCQLFVNAPRTYTLKPTTNAALYFPGQILPNASQCCMPNTTSLLDQLNTAPPTYADVPAPLCLVLDSNGFLVTASETNRSIYRFYPKNLRRIEQPASPVFVDDPKTLAHHNGAYYVGFNDYILVVHSKNMTVMHNMSVSELQGTRDMIFLHDGQQMIVASTYNHRVLFFNRSSPTSYNYDFVGSQIISCRNPYGLFYIHDALFYLISWQDKTMFSFSNLGNTTAWGETLVLNASLVASSSVGNHVLIDDCDRSWLSLGHGGVQIFDRQGLHLGSPYSLGTYAFDTLMLDNYVLYVSDRYGNKIIRRDPNIQC